MAKKAVLITKDNQDYFGSRFGIDDLDDLLPIGMYLVKDFGSDDHFDMVTKGNILNKYEFADKELENGFREIIPL